MFPSSQYKRLIISKNRRLVKGGAAVFCPFLEKIPPPSVREVGGLLHRLLALSFRASDRCHWRGNPQSFSCKFAEKRKNCAIWGQIATPVCGLARNDRHFRQPLLVDKPSLWGQRFIYAGGARGGKARLESDQMSRKALPCKACVERSDYFRAARRHKNNDIISGCRKKPEPFSTA